MNTVSVSIVSEINPDVIRDISRLELDTFGRGGLNEWHLPFIVRYGRLYTAKIDDKIVGGAELMRDWNQGGAYLIGLAVDKDERCRGIGKTLMEKIVSDLKSEGIDSLTLTVNESNDRAIGLYRVFGFKKAKNLPGEYGVGEDRIMMKLDLRI